MASVKQFVPAFFRKNPISVCRTWAQSLTTRMFLLVLLAVAPALAIQTYNEYDLRQTREAEIRNKTIQITRQFGEEMGELREGADQLLVALSRLPAVKVMDPSSCNRTLAALDESFPNYNILGVADVAGKVHCLSRNSSLTSVTDMPFFSRAMAKPGLAVGNYWVDPATGARSIHFGIRFSTETGGPVAGVVFAGLDLSWLAEHLKERGLTSTQSILIADREGNIVARLPNGDKLVGKNMRKGHAQIMDGNTAGWEEAKGVDGIVRIFGYVPPALPPYDFFLSAGESKEAALATIADVTRRGILLILAGFLLAVLAAWFGGNAFLRRPIGALLQVSDKWRQGDYAVRAMLKTSQSEVGQLASAFNAMADAVAARHAAQEKAETRLRELNATLEHRVEERTRELENANRAKSQFLANMSHEIRTPMNGIIGMMELLQHSGLRPNQLRQLETVRRSADTLLGIINGILDLSKIEAGHLDLESHEFDLRELVEDVTDLLGEAASRKNLELACFLPANVPTALVGDPGRLRQILTNLIGNAVKFTDHGEVVVSASLIEADANSALLQFEVKDTGIGISPEDQHRIFNAFSQADGSTKRRYGGTGLGLSIAKELAEMMGGSMSVTSEIGAGSAFRFSARFSQHARGVRRIGHVNRARRGLRVLVVDDNATNLEIMQDYLSREGIVTELANSGTVAMRFAHAAAERGQPFNIALVDMEMPEMNGLELARTIKSDPGLAGLQILMLTSVERRVSSEDREYFARQLTKPIRRSELLYCLDALAEEGFAEPDAEEIEHRELTGPWAGLRVLVAEDSPVNLEVAIGLLESVGCTIETATDGKEAVAKYMSGAFDIIFMDCQMPEMDGFEATAEIRKYERRTGRRTPIVALTANAINGDRELCLTAGMDDYLTKPFTRCQLCSVLRSLLAPSGPAGEPEQDNSPPPEVVPEVSENAVFDDNVLNALRQLQRAGRPDIVQRTLDLYLENAPRLLRELQDGADKGDVVTLGRASHMLKSNSANVGALKLASRCNELETLARAGSVTRAAELVVSVTEEFEAVKVALHAHLAKVA